MINFSVLETAHIDGGAYRVVEFADGSARVEEYRGDKWIPGGASLGEIFDAPPVSERFAAELGIPLEDIRPTPPVRTVAPAKLTAKDLREAIKLGVRLAEEEALFKLAMKAKQVTEHDRRRPRLVWDRNKGSIE